MKLRSVYPGTDGVAHIHSARWFRSGTALCGRVVFEFGPEVDINPKLAPQEMAICEVCRETFFRKWGQSSWGK